MMASLPTAKSWKQGTESDVSNIKHCWCPNCHGNKATTLLLPTKIPMFREIYIMTIQCPECHFRNSEVKFGGVIQPQGLKLTLTMTTPADLQRQLVKSDSASLKIPALSFEIPPETQKGVVSTIEGVISTAVRNLNALQPDRLRIGDLDNFYRCREVIQALKVLIDENDCCGEWNESGKSLEYPLVIELDDPAGNSFIENLSSVGKIDANIKEDYYERSPGQNVALGLQPCSQAIEIYPLEANGSHAHCNENESKSREQSSSSCAQIEHQVGRSEPLKFPTPCPSCNNRHAETSMCVIDIPHFKEAIIMSLLCESCGYRSNEVKPSGAISKYATKITLHVKSNDDLEREVLKSDSAGVKVPEIELELIEGGLGGVYTSVEGLLEKMHDRLCHTNPFCTGDSASMNHRDNNGEEFSGPSPNALKFSQILDNLKMMKEGKAFPFTLILDDALSNSFVGPVPKAALKLRKQAELDGDSQCYNNYIDPGVEVEVYKRTYIQDEHLGLNDMKTDQNVADDDIDEQEETSHRLNRLCTKGPDHPHAAAKGTSNFDDTSMGAR